MNIPGLPQSEDEYDRVNHQGQCPEKHLNGDKPLPGPMDICETPTL